MTINEIAAKCAEEVAREVWKVPDAVMVEAWAAIIARHFAPLEAENAALREVLKSTLGELQTVQSAAAFGGLPAKAWAGFGGVARKALSATPGEHGSVRQCFACGNPVAVTVDEARIRADQRRKDAEIASSPLVSTVRNGRKVAIPAAGAKTIAAAILRGGEEASNGVTEGDCRVISGILHGVGRKLRRC